jgi:predicted glycogen debranching enzyme
VKIWKEFGNAITAVINAYRNGTSFNIRMLENGLIWAGEQGKSLTWMDAVTVYGPVTPRMGMPVEINALWYNAIMVSLKWAGKAGDKEFVKAWEDLPERIAEAFIQKFWDPARGYLADYADGDFVDFSVRPNQVIAASMEYCMLDCEMKNRLLEVVKKKLLTPKGLRTLDPTHPDYKGIYEGGQVERDSAYHQGTVWPWLLEHFVKAYLDVHRNSGLGLAKQIYHGFEEDMTSHGIGSISEIYDGDPPHYPRGAVSQAWSVAALLRIHEMIEHKEKELNRSK